MSDTYTGECKYCKRETDVIESVCFQCVTERFTKAVRKLAEPTLWQKTKRIFNKR